MRLFERNATAEADIYKRLSFDPEQNTLSEEIIRARQDFEKLNYHEIRVSDTSCHLQLVGRLYPPPSPLSSPFLESPKLCATFTEF